MKKFNLLLLLGFGLYGGYDEQLNDALKNQENGIKCMQRNLVFYEGEIKKSKIIFVEQLINFFVGLQ